MINYDSILSAFDGKPTLLQWLKMVKKALDESILKNVNIAQNGQKVVFTFNFEDGTSISTPEVTLPKGDKGDKGDKGEHGVSITGINTVGNEVVGDETLTTLRAHYSNNTTDDFVVNAKNGKDSTIYLHQITIRNENSSILIRFSVYSKMISLTIQDALKFIPENEGIPVWFFGIDSNGVIVAFKSGANIYLRGNVYNGANDAVQTYSDSFMPSDQIDDIILGENL